MTFSHICKIFNKKFKKKKENEPCVCSLMRARHAAGVMQVLNEQAAERTDFY